jgi:gluconolactonase
MSVRLPLTLLTGWFIFFPQALQAQDKVDFSRIPLPADLVDPKAKPEAAGLVCFLEGPAVDRKGNVFFSDIAGNRILRYAVDGRELSIFRANSGRTNGNAFDPQGRLISCEGAEQGPGGGRRIVRTDLTTNAVTVVTDRFNGRRYNSPNDVCVDSLGRIWFTDPRYGPDRRDLELDVEGVYRVDPNGQVVRVLSQPVIQKPNGLAITPDNRTLYVIDSNSAPGGNRKIWAFPLAPDGTPGERRLVYDFGKGRGGDGMRLDNRGNLWVAAGILTPRSPAETTDVPPGVYVISPEGKLLGRIPILEDLITNLAFGPPDQKVLYVTAGKTLYRIPVQVAGTAVNMR